MKEGDIVRVSKDVEHTQGGRVGRVKEVRATATTVNFFNGGGGIINNSDLIEPETKNIESPKL